MTSNDLFRSAWENDVEAVRAALLAGVDPNEPHPRAGTVPLQIACSSNALEAIDVLLEGGARADIVFSPVSRINGGVYANRTPLMYVTSVEAAKRLLDAGGRLEAADGSGWTALVWAAFSGNLGLTQFFLDRGADTTVRPIFAGERRCLPDFLRAVAAPAPGAPETRGSNERRSELETVLALISSQSGACPST